MIKLNSRIFSLLVLSALILIAAAGCYYPAMEASEERITSFPLTGRLSLFVESDNGAITVHGQSGAQDVRVVATLRAWGTTQSEADNRLKNIQVEMHQRGNEVVLRHLPTPHLGIGIFRSDQVAFEVWIPSDADVDLHSDNGDIISEMINGSLKAQSDNGDQSHHSITGTFDLRSDNGDVNVSGASGSLIASTDNGDVEYSGHLVGAQHRVTTDNGDIRLTIPRDSALRIEVRVDNGSIYTRLPVEGEMKRKHWGVVLNAPDAILTLISDNGSISLDELR